MAATAMPALGAGIAVAEKSFPSPRTGRGLGGGALVAHAMYLHSQMEQIMKESIQALLRPASVAIVGATPGDGRGGWIHEQLLRHGYDGPIYPVNPKYAEIRGARAYPTLLNIPAPVEFVAVALGAGQALATIEQCARKGVRAALFVASGFAEAGPE